MGEVEFTEVEAENLVRRAGIPTVEAGLTRSKIEA